MSSQFFGLNIAYSGLTAASAALNTTGNNISNVETTGYSRQVVSQQASEALRTFTTYGCAGSGVETLAIERVRDEFYDVKYWNNNSDLGEYDVKQYYMKQVENYFTDDSTLEGFTTIFNKMSDALAEVKKDAGDSTTKTQFIGYANNLTDYFNSMASNLEEMQKDTNSEIKNNVDEINSLAEQISSLNKQINVIELTGTTANTLRDQRGVLIDKLSLITDVKTSETPITDANNADRETGANRFSVKIAGGQTLVDGDSYNTLVCTARANAEKINQSDADGLYDISWNNGTAFGMYGSTVGGQLEALIAMRDGNNGDNFNGTVTNVDLAANTVTVAVTADYLTDLNKCTLSDSGGVINIGNQEFQYDSWSYNQTYDAVSGTYSYSYTFAVDPAESANQLSTTRLGKEASVGASVKYQGIPYYQEQMNEWARSYASTFNGILTQTGSADAYGNAGSNLFTAVSPVSGNESSFTVSYNNATGVKSTDDSYYRMTAKNISITSNLTNDSGKLATHTGTSSGQDSYNIIDQLTDLSTNTSTMNFKGNSASEFLQTILSDISLNANNANTFFKNYQNVSDAIDVQRISVSGVDTDEEALNLVKYQNSYNLASKMIQVLSEIYDKLILETGV